MKYIKKICVGLALLAILICSGSSFAAMQYKLLSPLPDENGSISANQQITIGGQDEDLAKYFKNLYRLGILIATGLAVLMVMWGGIEYMTTDAIGGKEGGKEKIQNAVLGLMLALGSFLILRTIDPDLVDVGFNIDEIDQEKIKNLSGQAGSLEFLDIPEERAETEGNWTGNERFDSFPTGGQTVSESDLQPYIDHGKYRSHRIDSTHDGYHSPFIEYIYNYGERTFPKLQVSNTYRSPNHGQSVANSNSDHIVGQAIDFHQRGGGGDSDPEFIRQSLALVAWAKQNGQVLGIDQIIYREKNYRFREGSWYEAGTVSGHYNHVHIGRVRDGSETW